MSVENPIGIKERFGDSDPSPRNFKTYSFRLECSEDYTAFIVEAAKQEVQVVTSELSLLRMEGNQYPLPDTYVEFVSEAPLEKLRDILRNIVDSHVALQTLKQVPLKNNDLKRDYDLI
ncbi:hypothetical protein D3C78_824110 [compost metagenome]